MQILFLTSETEDYLSDSLFHGLRRIVGERVVDYPKADRLYSSYPAAKRAQLYGHGFTLYGLLDDITIDRSDIHVKVRKRFFDVIIFGSIWRNWEIFMTLSDFLLPKQTLIVDGEDSQNVFPYSYSFLKDRRHILTPRGKQYLYFKREFTTRSARSRWYGLPPMRFAKFLSVPKRFRPIAFSIPQEKIVLSPLAKSKDFPSHIVDGELALYLGVPQQGYPFNAEADYYSDLQCSRFGITTKRSGWDCMRHYEIAANGAVLCFRGLNAKEQTCAPHGLDQDNCIAYGDSGDLMRKINRLSSTQYDELREQGRAWARRNTTINRATDLLSFV